MLQVIFDIFRLGARLFRNLRNGPRMIEKQWDEIFPRHTANVLSATSLAISFQARLPRDIFLNL